MWVHSKLTGATVEITNEDALRTISRDPNYVVAETKEQAEGAKKPAPKKAKK